MGFPPCQIAGNHVHLDLKNRLLNLLPFSAFKKDLKNNVMMCLIHVRINPAGKEDPSTSESVIYDDPRHTSPHLELEIFIVQEVHDKLLGLHLVVVFGIPQHLEVHGLEHVPRQ